MRFALASPTADEAYIRHARIETMKAMDLRPTPDQTSPVAIAKYIFAYDTGSDPVGMAESAMLTDFFNSYDEDPGSAGFDLDRYCDISEMASIRTVFSEPAYRKSSIFLGLTLASAKLFRHLGARYASAATSASAVHLHRLYAKYGGENAGQGSVKGNTANMFVFDLDRLLGHRAVKRLSVQFDFELPEPSTI